MSNHTVQQRRALRYGTVKAEGDREVRAAQAHMHATSSTPGLQHWFEDRFGWLVALLVGFALAALTACANQVERPAPARNLSESKAACVKQKQTVVVGHNRYGSPVVLFTDKPCRSRR